VRKPERATKGTARNAGILACSNILACSKMNGATELGISPERNRVDPRCLPWREAVEI